MMLDKSHGKVLLKMLKNSEQPVSASIGLGDDLDVCAAIDAVPVLHDLPARS